MARMHEPHEKTAREKQLEAFTASVDDLVDRGPPRIQVLPRDDTIRKAFAHPDGNLKFPEGGGSVEWPLDSFTQRRLRDGTVTLASGQKLDPKVQGLLPTVHQITDSAFRKSSRGGAVTHAAPTTSHHESHEDAARRARPTPPKPPAE